MTSMPIDKELHRYILHYAASALQVCLPLIMDLLPSVTNEMESAEASNKSQAKKWTEEETTDLIDFMHQHRLEASSPGNFKSSTWTAAKIHLDNKHPDSPRTVTALKGKFNTYKDMFRVIQEYYSKSGMGAMPTQSGIWVRSSGEEQIYAAFEKSLGKDRKKYCHSLLKTPFPHFNKMNDIMDKSIAKGGNKHKGTALAPNKDHDEASDTSAPFSGPLAPSTSTLALSPTSPPSLDQQLSHSPTLNALPMDIDDFHIIPSESQATSPTLQLPLPSSIIPPILPPRSDMQLPAPTPIAALPVTSASTTSTSAKRKRAAADADKPQKRSASAPMSLIQVPSSSANTKNTTSISALVGATGAINNLTTTMQQSLSQHQ